MNIFQLGTIIFFMAVAVLALLIFSGIIPTPGSEGNQTPNDKLVVWGTLPLAQMKTAFSEIENQAISKIKVTYVKKDKETLELELLRASDNDASPDIVLFPADSLLQIDDMLLPLPETSVNERYIKDTFIEGGDIFITPVGVIALPLLVDPLMMYWNRDLFNKERLTDPPKTWDDVRSLTQVLTKTDGRGQILQSAVAIGESRNVNHLKDIVSLFFLQAGDGIILRNKETHEPYVFLGGAGINNEEQTPAVSALSFYTGFANVRASNYSWSGSFSSSLESFIEGSVAMYFAPASDYSVIVNKNPHLNFDVAAIPQLKNTNDVNFGRIYALGLSKKGKNKANAIAFSKALTSTNDGATNIFVKTFSLPPARRSLLKDGTSDATLSVFYKEALISKEWLDPKSEKSDSIFMRMVSDTLSESIKPDGAISFASAQLSLLLREIQGKKP